MRIPKKIGDEIYSIELSDQGINVTALHSGITKRSNLYNLNETITLSGRVLSISGKVMIYKKGNEIRLI